MKRLRVLAIGTAVALGGITAWPGHLAAQGGRVHPIDVELNFNQAKGSFEVLKPGAKDKVRVARGDTVIWRFHNRASIDAEAQIGRFSTPDIYKDKKGEKDTRRKKTPLVSNCTLKVKVPRHDPSTKTTPQIKCNIRTDIVDVSPGYSLTYKYAIFGKGAKGGKFLLDPEIEIEK